MKQLSLLGFLNAGKRDQFVAPPTSSSSSTASSSTVPPKQIEEDIREIFYYDRRPGPPVLTSSSDDSHASVLNGELFIDEENDTDADIDNETDDESLIFMEISDEDHDDSPEDLGEMLRYFMPCEVMAGKRSSSATMYSPPTLPAPAKKQPEYSTVPPQMAYPPTVIQDPEVAPHTSIESSESSTVRTPMHASPAELAQSIFSMSRDAYVKALAGNHPGYTPRNSRRRSAKYDKDGVIYLILNRSPIFYTNMIKTTKSIQAEGTWRINLIGLSHTIRSQSHTFRLTSLADSF